MKNINLLLAFVISFLVLNVQAQRIGFSDSTWKTIKTEHFDIIFTAEQHDLGLYYAQVAEKAYQNLQTVFTDRPEKTVLVINDSTDSSNGYATQLPYPQIVAYPVQVSDHESLSEAGEWARELITHEMTHILQFQPASGFYKFLRPIFGTIIAPTLLLPTWWKEGMAVEMETQFSPRGRLRSNYQDATLRAMVLDKELFNYTLASANETLPSWPYGTRPYLFGSIFWSQIVSEKGVLSADYIAQRQGERVPYWIEEPVRELTNENYETIYLRALDQIENSANTQLEQLKKLKPTNFETVKIEGQSAQQPIFSKAHQLLAFIESKDSEPEITILNRNRTFVENLKHRPTGHIDHIIFHPTLKQIYFTKMDRINSKQSFSDLYVYDLDSDKTTRITTEQRVRDPHFSEDGQQLVFVSSFDGKTQIKIIELATKKITALIDSTYQERFYSPLFWDSETILFAHKLSDGQQVLSKLNILNKNSSDVKLKYKNISFLKKIGLRLYFVSSESGVSNIYRTENLETAQPLTHSLTGVWSYSVDEESKKLWCTVMSSKGFQIAEVELDQIKTKLPAIENKIVSRYQFQDHSKSVAVIDQDNYSPSDYLLPHYWIPYIATTNTSKGIFVQAQTSGQDPLQIHRYSLLANYQTDINKFGLLATYTNSAFSIPFQLGSIQANQTFGTIEQVVETKTNYASFIPDIFGINKNLTFQFGVQNQKTDYLNLITEHIGAFTQIAYANYDQNIFQISPETGWGASARYEKNQNVQGSQEYEKAVTTLIGFTNFGLPKHHALMARLNGLITFQPVLARFGTSNSSAFIAVDTLIPQFVIRGYPTSQFYGRSLWTTNFEYRFPVHEIEAGAGTNPFFVKRLTGAIVADGLGVKGVGIDIDRNAYLRNLNESLWSVGVEAKFETTVGYILPMNFVLGCYLPFSPQYATSPQIGFQLQIGGF